MRFAPLRIDGSFTLHALTAGKKGGEKRPWKILPLLFPPSQQQTPLSDSRQIRKCAGRMPPPFLPPFFPPFFPPSVSCQIGGGERAGGRAARVVGSPLPHDDVFPPGLARSIPPSFRCNAEFTDFSNVAEPRELCLPYMHEYFALIFTEMPPSDECLIAVAAAARGSLFADPLNGAAFEFARFPQICRLARPVTHSPCCVLPHPMTFAYSPTKDSL